MKPSSLKLLFVECRLLGGIPIPFFSDTTTTNSRIAFPNISEILSHRCNFGVFMAIDRPGTVPYVFTTFTTTTLALATTYR